MNVYVLAGEAEWTSDSLHASDPEWEKVSDEWYFRFKRCDSHGMIRGEMRLQAVEKVMNMFPSAQFVLVGGYVKTQEEHAPFISKPELMKRWLISRYGMEEKKLETLVSTANTEGNFEAIGKHSKVAEKNYILTHFYHLPRVFWFCSKSPQFTFIPLCVESLLGIKESDIRELYGGDEGLQRVFWEIKGLGDYILNESNI